MTKLDELKDQVFRFKIYGYSAGRLFGMELTKNGDPTCNGRWTFRCRGNLKHIVKTVLGVAENCKEKGYGYAGFEVISDVCPSRYIVKAKLENECLEIKSKGPVVHYFDHVEWIAIYSGPVKDFPLLKRKEKAND